jgi:glycerol kinase
VPDSPSQRVMGLPTTRKLALKNKVVFGTGDYWHAPTLTANMSFVRAISQAGMSLFTIEHRPRALTGD